MQASESYTVCIQRCTCTHSRIVLLLLIHEVESVCVCSGTASIGALCRQAMRVVFRIDAAFRNDNRLQQSTTMVVVVILLSLLMVMSIGIGNTI